MIEKACRVTQIVSEGKTNTSGGHGSSSCCDILPLVMYRHEWVVFLMTRTVHLSLSHITVLEVFFTEGPVREIWLERVVVQTVLGKVLEEEAFLARIVVIVHDGHSTAGYSHPVSS